MPPRRFRHENRRVSENLFRRFRRRSFWVQQNDENIITAAVCRVYDSVVLSTESNADFEELWQFLKIIGFSTLSCEESVCQKLGLSPTRSGNIVRFEHLLRPLRGEAQMPRYPDLRDVYSLLVSSGFDRLGGRDEWIADVSRRMNRDTAQWSVIYSGKTLAACACALFVVDSAAFLGCVAAREDMRGRGLGGEAVLTLAERYSSEGRRVELFCKDGSIVEFYKNRALCPSADGPNMIQNRKYNMEQTFSNLMRKYSMLPKGLLSAPNTASRELRKTLSIISRRCSPLLSKTGSARAISPRPRATATATADARRSIKFCERVRR